MICRLCLKDIVEAIHIFDPIGYELNAVAVLAKHFWFEPKRDDPISTAICNNCWVKVSDFHEFYSNVEEAHRLLTERFSFKTESEVEEVHNKYAKHEPESNHDLEPDEVELQFNVLLEQNSEQMIYAAPVAKQNDTTSVTQTDVEGENIKDNYGECDESSSCNGDLFTDDYLPMDGTMDDDDEDDTEDGEDKLDINIKEEPSENRRTTRSNRKTRPATPDLNIQKQQKLTKTEADDEVVDANSLPSAEALPGKKRRGRPPKSQASPGQNQKPKITTARSKQKHSMAAGGGAADTDAVDDDVAAPKSYEIKMRQVDEYIAQFLRLNCDICAAEMSNFAMLRRHMSNMHNCKGYAICCSKKFYKRVLLADHIAKHLNPDCYKCQECDKVFADKQCMRNHFLIKHQPEEEKTFTCEHCPKKFAKPYLLEQHRVLHEARTHMCDVCQKGFPTATLLGAHIKIIHMNYGTMCDICAKVIRGRAAFQRHQLEHTGVVQPKVQCDKCGSWHKDKYSLQKHKRRHNEDGTRHVCQQCGKVAPNRNALLSHMRYVHESKRSFECSVCNKAFKKPINLREHMTTHTGEVLYKCPHCTKTFNSNANMHSHRKKMHPKEFEDARKQRAAVRAAQINSVRTKTTAEATATSTTTAGTSQMITIKTADDGRTHNILVTTDDEFNDQDKSAGQSIIFTVN